MAALIETGAATSIAPASLAPHVPVTAHTGQLVNMNGGEIEILGQKMVTDVTHKVVMNITFLIAEDVMNPSIGLDAPHQNEVQFHLFKVARDIFSRRVTEQYFASGITTIPQVWSLKGSSKVPFFSGKIPNTQCSTHRTTQIIAEIDFEVNSESRLNNSLGEDDDSNKEANPAQCLKIPETVSAAEREAHSLTHMPFRP